MLNITGVAKVGQWGLLAYIKDCELVTEAYIAVKRHGRIIENKKFNGIHFSLKFVIIMNVTTADWSILCAST